MPWLMKEVKKEMGNMIESRELLMGEFQMKKKLNQNLKDKEFPYDISREM